MPRKMYYRNKKVLTSTKTDLSRLFVKFVFYDNLVLLSALESYSLYPTKTRNYIHSDPKTRPSTPNEKSKKFIF